MMKRTIRRWTALLLSGLLLLMLAACGAKKGADLAGQPALTVNGQPVTAGEYAANYLYSKRSMEALMYQYSITDPWTGDNGDAYKDQLAELARSQVAALYIVPEQFKAAGLALTDEEKASAESISPQIAELGFTEELGARLGQYFLMMDRLNEYYFGEGGVMSPEESEIESYFQQNYYRAKHILVSSRDESGQPITDEAQLAALEKKAQDLYRRAVSGEDFDALVTEYGEDPGMSVNPDGYQFTDGEMVAEFQNATAALAENEISEPVRTDFGWHIIQRLPLRAEDRADVYGAIVTAITGMDLDRLLEQWIAQAAIEEEPLLSEITFDNVEDYTYPVS